MRPEYHRNAHVDRWLTERPKEELDTASGNLVEEFLLYVEAWL